jgi:hypothetical protein
MQNFLSDICAHLAHRCEVHTCIDRNNQSLNEAVAWANVIWVEWANELAVALTRPSAHGRQTGHLPPAQLRSLRAVSNSDQVAADQ